MSVPRKRTSKLESAKRSMSVIWCPFCKQNGGKIRATHIAAQSTDAGKTITWTPACADHVDGWNEGGDWLAPVFKLGERVE